MHCKSASSLALVASQLAAQLNRHYHHSAVLITAPNHLNWKQILSSFHVEKSTPSELPFKIEDNPGQYSVLLTREYRDEIVKVEAHMPNMQKDYWYNVNPYRIEMVINVSKNDGRTVPRVYLS
ncbi:hypothetical protein Q3G72_012442 [Acer saccharum]|nr:hypothetical protein Q3G72_012442 [Acer saccharum]